MGNAAATERFEKAEKTKILTATELELSSWEKLVEKTKKVSPLRSISLDKNKLEGPLPHSFLYTDPILKSLKVLDLSSNGITNIDAMCHLLVPANTKKKSSSTGDLAAYPPLDTVLEVVQALHGEGKKSFKMYPLENLNLSSNDIRSVPPCFLLQFPNVKVLKLAKNKNLTLESIDRFGNSSSSVSTIFLGATGLVDLDISGTSITSLNPLFDLVSCIQASKADLYGDYWGKALTKLNQVNASGCRVGRVTVGSDATTALFKASLGETDKPEHQLTCRSFTGRFGKLQVVDVSQSTSALGAQHGVEHIDPLFYAAVPNVNRLVFDNSKSSRQKLVDALKKSDHYKTWEVTHADVVDRQIASGADARLMD